MARSTHSRHRKSGQPEAERAKSGRAKVERTSPNSNPSTNLPGPPGPEPARHYADGTSPLPSIEGTGVSKARPAWDDLIVVTTEIIGSERGPAPEPAIAISTRSERGNADVERATAELADSIQIDP